MIRPDSTRRLFLRALGAWVISSGLCTSALCQSTPGSSVDLWRDPVLPRDLAALTNRLFSDPTPPSRDSRIRLFRMPTAFPSDPIGLDLEGDSSAPDLSPSTSADKNIASEGRLQLAMGADNPFFDFRKPSDPGGVGFYRLHSQVVLLDNRSAGLSMGLQAVTPAGLEADGLADGPTIVSPNFAVFYELKKGTAIQGYVGKDVRANSRWTENFDRDIQYGVALQSPFPWLDYNPSANLHLFVEALGRYRSEPDPNLRAPGNWELLPGIHWRLSESWWMSGGILMPLTAPRLDSRLWQITCSWQF